MKKTNLFLVVLLIPYLLVGCAHKTLELQGEQVASSDNTKILASASIIEEFSDPYNVLVQFNLESKDGNWVRVDSVDLDMRNKDNAPYNVIVGNDLKTWQTAKLEEYKIRSHNRSMTSAGLGALGLLAAGVGGATGNDSLATAGALLYTGVLINDVYEVFQTAKGLAQGVALVPENYILAPMTIPSMSLVKKWVLINFPDGRMATHVTLKLKTIEGETLAFRVPLVKVK